MLHTKLDFPRLIPRYHFMFNIYRKVFICNPPKLNLRFYGTYAVNTQFYKFWASKPKKILLAQLVLILYPTMVIEKIMTYCSCMSSSNFSFA